MSASTGLLIFLIAVGAVAFLIAGFSLSLLFRGRHPDTEIGTNPAMRERGIACTAQQFRKESAAVRGEQHPASEECAACSLSSCGLHPEKR